MGGGSPRSRTKPSFPGSVSAGERHLIGKRGLACHPRPSRSMTCLLMVGPPTPHFAPAVSSPIFVLFCRLILPSRPLLPETASPGTWSNHCTTLPCGLNILHDIDPRGLKPLTFVIRAFSRQRTTHQHFTSRPRLSLPSRPPEQGAAKHRPSCPPTHKST